VAREEGNLDGFEHLDSPAPGVAVVHGSEQFPPDLRRQRHRLADVLVETDRLGDLLANAEGRVETVQGVLEHHRDPTVPCWGRLRPRLNYRIAVEPYLTLDDLARGLEQTDDRFGQHRLAAARLPDESDDLTGFYGQIDTVDRPDDPPVGVELRPQVPHVEQAHRSTPSSLTS
jgi:hypothetical protein